MMILGAIIFIIAAIAVWIIFVPVILTIDSSEGKYEISQRASFRLVFNTSDTPHMSLHLLGLRKLRIGIAVGSAKPHPVQRERRQRQNTKSIGAWRGLISDVIQSFTIDKVKMNIDTGDYVLNAQLVPVALLCCRGPVMIRTNFVGLNNVYARIELRVYLLIRAFLLFTLKK